MIKELTDQTAISEIAFARSYEADLIKIIRSRLGIVVHSHQKKDLYRAMSEACKTHGYTPAQYINLLNNCEPQSPVLEHLVAEITVGETYFYRDKRQIEQLKATILPRLISHKRKTNELSLRIWSAGCSSGEEIYTIAMILQDLLNDIDQWTINLLGTDINTEVLKKALAAQYSEWSMRSIPNEIKNKYFSLEKNKYYLDNKISTMVKFDYLNLNENTYPSIFNGTNSQDLIICRNVFIYFDNEIVSQMMNKFYSCLSEGGYLLLGASDPIDTKAVKADFHYVDNMLFMRETRPILSANVQTKPTSPVAKHSKALYKTGATQTKPLNDLNIIDKKFDKNTILDLLENSQWQAILLMLDKIDPNMLATSFYLYAKATALANLGKLETAVTLFESALKMDPTNIYAHFTYALTLLELNKFSAAEDELRKSIYLDRNFVIGHYQLGLLLLRNKQIEAGLKSLKNAHTIVMTKTKSEHVPGSKGLSYSRLSEILEHEIAIYSSAKDDSHA